MYLEGSVTEDDHVLHHEFDVLIIIKDKVSTIEQDSFQQRGTLIQVHNLTCNANCKVIYHFKVSLDSYI